MVKSYLGPDIWNVTCGQPFESHEVKQNYNCNRVTWMASI